MDTPRLRRHGWTPVRRAVQALCLALFFFLFVHTDSAGIDALEYAVNILFRIDPFLAASVWLAGRTVIALLWPALVTLIATFLFGRFFCGWICPLGALLDFAHGFVRPRNRRAAAPPPSLRFLLLVFLLAAAAANFPLAGYVDPFSLLVRGLALSFFPGINAATVAFFTFTYQELPGWVNAVTEPVYAALKATVLPFSQKWFQLAYPAAAMLLAVFLLELRARRFFCRSLCPTGALLGLTARMGLMRGQGGDEICGGCAVCRNICRMDAIAPDRTIGAADCTLCMECVDRCPKARIGFAWQRPGRRRDEPLLSRRGLLAGVAAGLALPFSGRARAHDKRPDPLLIRPPGALAESAFLGRCVRCGECMQVCIGNALQPVLFEAGLEGMFTPKLVPRLGYCEYNCTLCGQVCPTGAIQRLPAMEKQRVRVGTAWFDKNRCLPYAKGIACIVCEEHCPTPEKAIRFSEAEALDASGRTVTVKQPYVVEERCIGCGICERKCPLPGEAAVRVTSAGESRHAVP